MKKKFTVTFDTKTEKVKVEFSEKLTAMEALMAIGAASQGILETALRCAPEGSEQEYKEYLYDRFNGIASGVLANFAPDIEQRPNLTEEAILRAENEILEEHYKNTPPSKRKKLVLDENVS